MDSLKLLNSWVPFGMYAFLHFTFASGIGRTPGCGSCGYFLPLCRVFSSFSPPASGACTYESEIDRQDRERIGRLSDCEAGKECRFITLCPIYSFFTWFYRGVLFPTLQYTHTNYS